jgi:hypothetical protein
MLQASEHMTPNVQRVVRTMMDQPTLSTATIVAKAAEILPGLQLNFFVSRDRDRM